VSAPVTHDPVAVNTQDGSCWTRRAVTRDGRGLYALADVKGDVPELVLATLPELAEHGLGSMAFALPMPVGPEPQESPVDADRAKAPWGRGEDGRPLLPMGAHWTDIPELVDRTLASIQARVDQAQPGHWYVASDTETWRPPGTVRTNVDGYQRTVGQCTNMLPADLELVLHAHDDLSWCLDMIAKLRSRVAELEAERHSTNESLSQAAEALRANRDRIAELEDLLRLRSTQRGDIARLIEVAEQLGEDCLDNGQVEETLSLGADDVPVEACEAS
jgi:hypothetical protein